MCLGSIAARLHTMSPLLGDILGDSSEGILC
jgi:hypothetical protein